MTTLYRPVLIESAEQAEALPVGTVALDPGHESAAEASDYGPGTPAVRCRHYEPTSTWFSDYEGSMPAKRLVGWTALVPIEAEEERARSQINITHLPPPAPQMVPVRLPCPRCGLR
ncbi:MAG: hypothetical protein ACTIA5_01525 [Brachybacterium tyrofermentans]